MLNNVSFCAKPIIHDYYPIEETAKEIVAKAKKNAEKTYTRFDGINEKAHIKEVALNNKAPAAGSNVHLGPEAKIQEAVDNVNTAAAVDKYEQFSSF